MTSSHSRKSQTFGLPVAFVGILLLPIIGWSGCLFVKHIDRIDRTRVESMNSPSDWPPDVQDLHALLLKTDPTLAMDGLLLDGAPGPSSVSAAAFRVSHATPALFSQIQSHLQLVAITRDDRTEAWQRNMIDDVPPDWCVASQESASFYASQNLVAGEDGDWFLVAFASETNTIYIHYLRNF